jgi:hypothetical protein
MVEKRLPGLRRAIGQWHGERDGVVRRERKRRSSERASDSRPERTVHEFTIHEFTVHDITSWPRVARRSNRRASS